MADNLVFNFIRTPDFIDNMNRVGCFDVYEMDGTTKNYKFELSTSCPDNIEGCIKSDGTLDRSKVTVVDIGDSGEVPLVYSRGVNNNRTISLGASSVTVDVGDIDVYLKGIFLVDMNTDYVFAYAILTRTVPIGNEVILPASGLVWNIRNEA